MASADSTYDAAIAATEIVFQAVAASADTTFDSDVSSAFANCESTVSSTRRSYDVIVAGSEALRDIGVGIAELGHEADLTSAASMHLTAIASANSTYDTDFAAANANRDAAMSGAQSNYDTAIASALAIYLAGPADENQTAPLDLQSDPIYVSAVNVAATTAQNSIDAAFATYDLAIATADSDYETAIADAQSAYDGAVATAYAAYALSESMANSAHQATVDSAQSAHDTAVANADSTFASAMASAKNEFDTAVANAKATRDSTVNAAKDAFDSLKGSKESQRDADNAAEQNAFDTTDATAAEVRDNALTSIESGFDADANAADTTFQNAVDAAQDAHDLAIANAVSAREGALQSAKNSLESTISSAIGTRNSALDSARADRSSAKTSATDDLNSAYVAAKEAQEVSRRDAESTYNDAIIDANQILWDAKETRDDVVFNAYMMMGVACNDLFCYEAAMNAASAIQQGAEDTYNAAKAQADAKGAALRAHREAVANAEHDYHSTVWPEFESFVETAAEAQQTQAEAVADATASYRQALANVAVDYLTANGPIFVGLATDVANVEKDFHITIAEINKDAATQGGDDRIAELNAKDASEFSGYEPIEPDSFADMLLAYLNYGLQSILDYVAAKYDEWIGETARKIGTAFGFLNSLPQQHQMNQAAKTLATRRMVSDDPSITVQDYVNLYKLPPEALTAIEVIASSYIQFLGSGASFASPSVAAMNGMPAAMQMEARAALADIGLSPCFVAGTTVVTAADSDAAIIVADQYIGIAMAGVAIAGYEVSRRRTKRKRQLEQEGVFENWPEGNDVDPFEDDTTIFDSSMVENERLSDEDWYAEPTWSMNSLYQDADTWNEEWTPMEDEEKRSVLACCNTNSTVDGGLTHSSPQPLTLDLPRALAKPRRTWKDRARRSECKISPAKRTAAVATNRNAYGKIWLAVMLLAAGWIGFHSSFSADHEALVPIASHIADVNSAIATTNIEDVRVGDRVHAENPTDDRDDPFVSNINRWTWRTIHFQAEKLDGGAAEVTLLRPEEWLRDNDVRVGRDIHLTLREVGIDGPARVLTIGDCPKIKPGVGQIVTGTFKHTAANVVDLHIDSLDEPIGVTANHPFWSHDRQDFIPAGGLQPGERLKTLEGLAKVTSITERGPPEAVYNFEVHLHHVYHVTDVGVLVHNDCNATGGVYVLRDPTQIDQETGLGKVVRTGRTNNLKRRETEHGRQSPDLQFDPIHQTDEYAQQRGLEELLHQEFSGAPLNRTGAISAKNKRFGDYVTAAIQYLKDKADFDREVP